MTTRHDARIWGLAALALLSGAALLAVISFGEFLYWGHLRGGFAAKDFLIMPPYLVAVVSIGFLGLLCAAVWLAIVKLNKSKL